MYLTTDTRAAIGARVRAARTRAGYSQVELASRMGCDPTQISRWEGSELPSLANFLLLAKYLCVGLDDLAGDASTWSWS